MTQVPATASRPIRLDGPVDAVCAGPGHAVPDDRRRLAAGTSRQKTTEWPESLSAERVARLAVKRPWREAKRQTTLGDAQCRL